MSILCKLFGHRMPTGYAGGRPYLKPSGGTIDEIGTHHSHLYGVCPRCGKGRHIANIHQPQRTDALCLADEVAKAKGTLLAVHDKLDAALKRLDPP